MDKQLIILINFIIIIGITYPIELHKISLNSSYFGENTLNSP